MIIYKLLMKNDIFYDALRYKGNYSKLNSQWFQQGHS